MNQGWNDADRPPPDPPGGWAADGGEAFSEDTGLPSLPEAVPEHTLARLAALFRDHPPPDPSGKAWRAVLARIEAQLPPPRPLAPPPGRPRPRARWLLSGLLAAAALAGVLVGRALLPGGGGEADLLATLEEVLPVVSADEVNILHMDARDADRIVTGQPLVGAFDLAAGEDIEIVQVEADLEDGALPRLLRRAGLPMIVLAHADDDEEP